MDAVAAFLLLLAATTTIAIAVPSVCARPTATATAGGCIAAERAALLSFKAGITRDPLDLLGSWEGHECCHWSGVTCSNRTGRVVKLRLRNALFYDDQMSGRFPRDGYPHGLRGKLSPSLLALQYLKYLDLSGNCLGGAGVPIPEFLGSLARLTYLNLSFISFDGSVPPRLGNLSKLLYLDINTGDYVTTTPVGNLFSSDISWLVQFSSLRYLDMSGVNLSTVAGLAHVVNSLPNLRVLRLCNCRINSSIPAPPHHNLTNLEALDLSSNPLSGQASPNWFWNIVSLKKLSLEGCALSGKFPDELGNLTSLETLDLGANDLSGMIPSTMQNLCNLNVLDLAWNDISGDVKDLMGRFPNCSLNKLQVLYLYDTNMAGSLPNWLGNITNLHTLDLSENSISGSVPAGIGALTQLTYMNLRNNNLSGMISEEHFANLSSLKVNCLSYNHLEVAVDPNWVPPFKLQYAEFASCQIGPQFPTWLKSQEDIIVLDISAAGIIGSIPDWFWTIFYNAASVNLSYNQISGELSPVMKDMSVELLFLQSNQLTGSIPQLSTTLKILDISRNSLNGPLSSNFGSPQLEIVNLFSNYITGSIPTSICEWHKLGVLDLSSNLLVGSLPRCGMEEQEPWNSSGIKSLALGSSYSSLGIRTLLLRNNGLSGEFPFFLNYCKNLTILDLAYNKFTGSLPSWISEKLPSLLVLQLRSNLFSGHIPLQVTELENLRFLDLADNNLSGNIPHPLANFKGMITPPPFDFWTIMVFETFEGEYLDNDGNQVYFGQFDDRFSVIIKGQELKYSRGLRFVVSIDLSCNNLTGHIPEGIVSLAGIINLNLSGNLLSGHIPDKIGLLRSLESLDLSNNKLSNEIPSSLSNLTSLAYLNLSYNNLSGRIPSGNQLDTLNINDPASMYLGNAGLCGHPLPKNCSENVIDRGYFMRGLEHSSSMYFYLGLSMGFVVGLWVVFCSLLFKKAWRVAYFHLFDRLTKCVYLMVRLG